MSISIREKILVNIETTLAGIQGAPTYNNTFVSGSVQRFKQRGNSKAVCPCMIITAAPEEKEFGPDPYYTNRFSVGVEVYISQSEEDADDTDPELNSLLDDIIKALMADVTRGGNARETAIKNITPFILIENQPYAGLIIEVEILYLHLINDPATAG